jgi:putative FmdB family regulatory protein
MPFYDYSCSACGHVWEELHGMNERRKKCPACKKNTAKKHIGTVGFRRDHTVN